MDLLRHLAAHIAVVPRLIDDPRNVCGAVGIAQDKSIAPAVGHKPLLGGCRFLRIVQIPVAGVNNVHRQAQLMLAGTGHSHLPGSLFLVAAVGRHLPVKQGLLCIPCAVCRAYIGAAIPIVAAIVHHFLQLRIAAAVDLRAAVAGNTVQRCQLRLISLLYGVPRIHQRQIPYAVHLLRLGIGFRLRLRIRLLLLLRLLLRLLLLGRLILLAGICLLLGRLLRLYRLLISAAAQQEKHHQPQGDHQRGDPPYAQRSFIPWSFLHSSHFYCPPPVFAQSRREPGYTPLSWSRFSSWATASLSS